MLLFTDKVVCTTFAVTLATEEVSLFEEKDSSQADFCDQRTDGTYADLESDCRKFFFCEKRHQYKFSCPPGTRFFQRFEECSIVSQEEEASFDCNEMTHAGQRHSQSLLTEDAAKEAFHNEAPIRRIDADDTWVREKKVLDPEAIETQAQLSEYLKAVLTSSASHPVPSVSEGDEHPREQESPPTARKSSPEALSPCEAARLLSLHPASRIRRHVGCS